MIKKAKKEKKRNSLMTICFIISGNSYVALWFEIGKSRKDIIIMKASIMINLVRENPWIQHSKGYLWLNSENFKLVKCIE